MSTYIGSHGHSGLFNGLLADPANGLSGPNYFGFIEDFLGGPEFPTTTPAAVTPTPWTRTLVNSSVSVYQAADLGVGGVLKMTNDTAQNDAQQYVWTQEIFKAFGPSTTQTPAMGGLDMHFEIRCAMGDITNMDWGFGFSKTGTTNIATAASDVLGVRKVNKTTFSLDAIKVSSAYSGTDATSFVTVPDTGFHTYYFRVEPYNDLSTGALYFYMDGNLKGAWTRKGGNALTLPLVSMGAWFGQLSHAASMTGSSLVGQVDYIACAQKRWR